MPDRKMKGPVEESAGYDIGQDANNVLTYDGDAPFQDRKERAGRVEGWGPLGLAPYPGDTDAEDEPSGFLKDNNVRDRI